jgi:hypothetical protein
MNAKLSKDARSVTLAPRERAGVRGKGVVATTVATILLALALAGLQVFNLGILTNAGVGPLTNQFFVINRPN